MCNVYWCVCVRKHNKKVHFSVKGKRNSVHATMNGLRNVKFRLLFSLSFSHFSYILSSSSQTKVCQRQMYPYIKINVNQTSIGLQSTLQSCSMQLRSILSSELTVVVLGTNFACFYFHYFIESLKLTHSSEEKVGSLFCGSKISVFYFKISKL